MYGQQMKNNNMLRMAIARLPIRSDCAPYYLWADFRRYCLKKLDRYEKRRNNSR